MLGPRGWTRPAPGKDAATSAGGDGSADQATVTPWTSRAPALRRASAAAANVAPVVTTSSTTSTRRPARVTAPPSSTVGGAASSTTVMAKVEPTPCSLSTVMSPSIACAMRRLMARPRPVPP